MKRLGILLWLALPLLAAADSGKTMRLASLEWVPFVGAGLEQDGLSAHIANSAAGRFGYRARVDYYPWTRAIQLGQKDPQYAGYFPAYYTEERARQCHFSAPIGNSTVVLAHLKSVPLQWQSLADLSTLRIAVVSGYSNGPDFDALVKQGRLQVDASPNETLNLRKLLAHRVDAAVIDKQVLRYLLAAEPSLKNERDQIAFHERPLAELSLHVCFQKTPAGRELQQAFNAALQTMPLQKLENEYFHRLERKTASSQP